MIRSQKPLPSIEQVAAWLKSKYETDIEDLTPLSGGFWSSAFGFRVGSEAFVLRLGATSEGYIIDRAAMRFNGPNLPVPEVLEIGQALGFHYAISRRHFGRFIETVSAAEGDAAGGALDTLLAALRAVPSKPGDPVVWFNPEAAPNLTWHGWLTSGLQDHPDSHTSGWRAKLAEIPRINTIFKAGEARIRELLPVCPERRDLIHGDLLHQNVLVSPDAARVTAIFSWKCSALGDFLYDVAWCTFWRDWHPGIAAADIWERTWAASDLTDVDLENASLRHHCYELQIGMSHIGWYIWLGDQKNLEAVAAVLKQKLEKRSL